MFFWVCRQGQLSSCKLDPAKTIPRSRQTYLCNIDHLSGAGTGRCLLPQYHYEIGSPTLRGVRSVGIPAAGIRRFF